MLAHLAVAEATDIDALEMIFLIFCWDLFDGDWWSRMSSGCRSEQGVLAPFLLFFEHWKLLSSCQLSAPCELFDQESLLLLIADFRLP